LFSFVSPALRSVTLAFTRKQARAPGGGWDENNRERDRKR
jgi:hypothetical protein